MKTLSVREHVLNLTPDGGYYNHFYLGGWNHALIAAAELAQNAYDSQQAKIDALLEYCPDEMTPEQLEEWRKHQVVTQEPLDPEL